MNHAVDRAATPHAALRHLAAANASKACRARRSTRLAALPLAVLTATLLLLSACAPTIQSTDPATVAAFDELERAAQVVYHSMELERLELGGYTTTPLTLAVLPEGSTLTLIDYDAKGRTTYTAVLASQRFRDVAWQIEPSGVKRIRR